MSTKVNYEDVDPVGGGLHFLRDELPEHPIDRLVDFGVAAERAGFDAEEGDAEEGDAEESDVEGDS